MVSYKITWQSCYVAHPLYTGSGESIQGYASITDIPLIPDQQMGEKAATEVAKVLENLVQVGKEEQF